MRAFVGYGELGRQMDLFLREHAGDAPALYFDDLLTAEGAGDARPFASYLDDEYRDCEFYVCLGYRHLSRKVAIFRELIAAGRRVPSFVHPTAYVSRSAQIGPGTFVYPLANIDKECVLGAGVIVNNSAIVSHNASIGDCCYLSPGVVLSGFVTVGAGTFLGAGAIVRDTAKVGENVTIGMGSVVTGDLSSNTSAIGNPLRILRRPLRL